MRPLESFGSGGRADVVSGLGAASEVADFFFGGKGEFYQDDSFEFREKQNQPRTYTDRHGYDGRKGKGNRGLRGKRGSDQGKGKFDEGLTRIARFD
jgi:hypothetical protein